MADLKSYHLDLENVEIVTYAFARLLERGQPKKIFGHTDRCKLLVFCLPCFTTKVIL